MTQRKTEMQYIYIIRQETALLLKYMTYKKYFLSDDETVKPGERVYISQRETVYISYISYI
jgi:hypothetical protein